MSPTWELSYVFRARARKTGTHLFLERLRFKGQWCVKEGRAGLGQLTFLRHKIGSGVFLNVLHFVWERRDGSGIGEHIALCGSVKFLPEGAAIVRKFDARRWRIGCSAVCLIFPFGGPVLEDKGGESRLSCRCWRQKATSSSFLGWLWDTGFEGDTGSKDLVKIRNVQVWVTILDSGNTDSSGWKWWCPWPGWHVRVWQNAEEAKSARRCRRAALYRHGLPHR